MGARVAPEDAAPRRRRRVPAAAAPPLGAGLPADPDAVAHYALALLPDERAAREVLSEWMAGGRSPVDVARVAVALGLGGHPELADALFVAPRYDGEVHGAAGLDLAQLQDLARQLGPDVLAQLRAAAPQLERMRPLFERGMQLAREASAMGCVFGADDAVGRESIVRRSADPANVGQLATLALGALAHEPPLDTPTVQALVQAFQRAYGQGLTPDGVYGSATRGALSNILDILPRSLPALRRDAPYQGPPFDAGALPPAPAPTAAPAPAPTAPASPPPTPAAPEAGPPVGPGGPVPVAPPPEVAQLPSPSATTPAPPVAPAPPAPAAPPTAPIQPDMTREEAAARSVGPLTACLQLCNTLSGLLPERAMPSDTASGVGVGTRRQLLPYFARIDALLVEAGAPMLLASRNLDLFNPNLPAVQVMGVDIVGDLAADAAGVVQEARSLGETQARTASAYAIAHTVGWVTRFRDAYAELLRGVQARIEEMRQSPSRIGDRVTQLLTQWSQAANQALNDLSSTLTGAVVTTAAAGAGFLLVLLLVLWLLASRTPRP